MFFCRIPFVMVTFLCIAVPGITHAQTIPLTINAIAGALDDFIAVAFGVAFIVFVLMVVRYIQKAGDDSEVSKARAGVMWSLVGLFFIVSIWGVVAILSTIFDIDTDKTECKSPSVVVKGDAYELTTCED